MKWLLYAILGAIFAGVSPVFAKSGVRKANPYLAAAFRGTFLFLSAFFMVKWTGTEQDFLQIEFTSLIYLIFSGIATGLVWIFLLRALKHGEVIKVVPIAEASIVLNILVGILFFQDSVNWNVILILILLGVGAFLMAFKDSGRGGKSNTWLGYAVVVMIFTTMTMIFERIGIYGVNSYYNRLVRYGIALILVWIAVFATKGYKGLRSMLFLDGSCLCMSGAVMGAAWYCFQKAYLLSADYMIEMIERFDLAAAVVLSSVFLNERMTVRSGLGMIFMMLGFWMLWADLPIIPL